MERSDTRLFPEESLHLFVPWSGSRRARLWLEIHPDDYYHYQVYEYLLEGANEKDPSTSLIAEADSLAQANQYRLFETELMHP